MKLPPLPLIWQEEKLQLLDQRLLPLKEVYITIGSFEECCHAIKEMIVRGAPLIGFTGIFGLALWIKSHPNASMDDFIKVAGVMKAVRPTAVNLAFEVDNAFSVVKKNAGLKGAYELLVSFAHAQMEELAKKNLYMAKLASEELLKKFGERPLRAMTICNTGVLACGVLGTALGAITHLYSLGRIEKVWVSETRPYQQGLRLTSYELLKSGIPHDVVVEGAFSYLMQKKLVDVIFVGADRIVKNGDTANKIGTSTLSIIAKNYAVPFYVVAPSSSFDLCLPNGESIEIELRDPREILQCQGKELAASGVSAFNPSFDVTSADFITGIFCEKGFISPVNESVVMKAFA